MYIEQKKGGEGERVFGVSFAFHTLAAIFDDRNHAGLPAERKSLSDQFLRLVSPVPGSASHYSGLNPVIHNTLQKMPPDLSHLAVLP